jgi:hypothetical protein
VGYGLTRGPRRARIHAPAQLTHPKPREFAVLAAWIATLAESANDQDLLVDVPPEDRVPGGEALGRLHRGAL